MTTYFELATDDDTGQLISWENASTWNWNSVPGTPSDGVIFQAGSGPIGIYLNAGVIVSIASLQMNANSLLLGGSLTSAANINLAGTATILLDGGSLSAGHIVINGGGLTGLGSVTSSGSLEIYSSATASSEVAGAGLSPGTLTLSGATFYNSGTLEAGNEGTLLVETTQANGFLNFNNGTLTGGTYQLDSGGTLELKTNGEISTDAANLIINGNYPAMMQSYNTFSGQFVNIEVSLDKIASTGTLTIQPGFEFAVEFALTVDGKVQINENGLLGAHNLIIDRGGSITYSGNAMGEGISVANPYITDNGTITALATAGASTVMAIQANITGNGSVVIGPAIGSATVTVNIEDADSANIVFSDKSGTAILSAPTQVTGTIQGFTAGDGIELGGVAYSSVTGYSYSGGTLTIDEGGTAIKLAFAGSYTTQEFSISSGPGQVALIGLHAATAGRSSAPGCRPADTSHRPARRRSA